jgi:hypothetical protein
LRRRDRPLGRPPADTLRGSKLANLEEPIIQHGGDPYRLIFIFDPCPTAILLLAGQMVGPGNKRYVLSAFGICEQYLVKTWPKWS